MHDYTTVTKDGVTPVIRIAHQRIGGIHMILYTKDGYEQAKVRWDGRTLWVTEGSIGLQMNNIPKLVYGPDEG